MESVQFLLIRIMHIEKFAVSDTFRMNLQTRYDLEVEKDRLGLRPEEEIEPLVQAS